MGETTQTREIPALQMRAAFEPATLNREKRTVEVTWSTGARVLRGFWDRFWEELSMDARHVRLDRLNNGAAYLANHDAYDVVKQPGVVERAWLTKADDGTPVGRALVRFVKAGVDPEADRLFEKIADGITLNTSIGYRVHKFEKVSDDEDGIPVMRAVDWTPNEISSVSVGADDGAGVRSAAPQSATNPCEFITRGEAPQKETKMPDETKPPAPGVDATRTQEQIDAEKRAQLAERERANTIRVLAKRHNLPEEFSQRLIDTNATIDAARSAVLDELAKRSDEVPIQGNHRITAGEDQRDKFMRGAEAWLVMRSGHGQIVERAAKNGRVKAPDNDPGEFRGMSLIGLARESLERSGVSTRRMTDQRIAELALMKRAPGMATASDFPILLENVTNKVLLSAYDVTPNEWSRFCGRGSVANFYEHNRYRKGAFGTLDAVNDHGELKNKAIPDGEKRAVSVNTYGNTLGITRKTLIQDDMGVFTDLASAFGMAAMNTVEAAVWTVVKANTGLGANYDANPLFHSSRSNINTTGSALSVAGLDADRVIMKRQPAPSGTTTLNLSPAVLVLPAELGMLARTLNSDSFDPDGTNPKFQKSNGVRGLFRDIVDSAQITGTRRYLFADPAVAPVIEVTFLQGQESPQMESQEGFEVLGLQWRVFLDFGVNVVDYRGAVTNAGQ